MGREGGIYRDEKYLDEKYGTLRNLATYAGDFSSREVAYIRLFLNDNRKFPITFFVPRKDKYHLGLESKLGKTRRLGDSCKESELFLEIFAGFFFELINSLFIYTVISGQILDPYGVPVNRVKGVGDVVA